MTNCTPLQKPTLGWLTSTWSRFLHSAFFGARAPAHFWWRNFLAHFWSLLFAYCCSGAKEPWHTTGRFFSGAGFLVHFWSFFLRCFFPCLWHCLHLFAVLREKTKKSRNNSDQKCARNSAPEKNATKSAPEARHQKKKKTTQSETLDP